MRRNTFDRNRRQALKALSALAVSAQAGAQTRSVESFPTKPIQLMFPFPPGGSLDPLFRALCEAASKELGQPVVIVHKPGAGGVTGTAALASMTEADGYTLGVMHNAVIRAPLVQKVKELGFDLTIDSPMGLVAPRNLDPAIAARLGAAFRKAATDPTYRSLLELYDMQPQVISGEAYAAYARTAYDRDAKMLAEIGFKLE